MPDKKDNTTTLRVYNDTNELISTIKRQLSAKLNTTLDNPQTVAHIVEFYLKAQWNNDKGAME